MSVNPTDTLRAAINDWKRKFEQVRDTYNLPPNFTKRSETRAARHIALHGDISVELDALPVDVLRQRIVDCVEQVMDLDALEKTRRRERAERRQIARRLGVTG